MSSSPRDALTLTLTLTTAMSCGAPRHVANAPRVPPPDALAGAWTMERFAGAPDGPSRWAEASFSASECRIASGERSKDSGSWELRGHCAVTSGAGSQQDPYRVALRVTEARGDERHPPPARRGARVELRAFVGRGLLDLQLPGSSAVLAREGARLGGGDPRYACARSDDCVNTPGRGAVNQTWLSEQVEEDPRDASCAGPEHEQRRGARCLAGACVALRGGGLDPACTFRALVDAPQ